MIDTPRIPSAGLSPGDAAGFSLTEFIIAAAILLVISLPLFQALNEIQKTAVNQADAQEVLDNTRSALETVRRLVLQAGNDPCGNGFEPISIVSPTEIRIRSDRTGSEAPGRPDKGDPDGDTGDSGENIAIRYNNMKQRLELIHGSGPAQIIAGNISDFRMEYFDSDGKSTDIGGRVRKIVVTISGMGSRKSYGAGKRFGIMLQGTIRIFS